MTCNDYVHGSLSLIVLVGAITRSIVTTVDGFSHLSYHNGGSTRTFRNLPFQSRVSPIWSVVNQTVTEVDSATYEVVDEPPIIPAVEEESTTLDDERHNASWTAEQLIDKEFMEKAIELAQTRCVSNG